MTVTVPVDHVLVLLAEHPWLAVATVVLFGVVLPAVWSTRRHAAAMAVMRIFVDALIGVAIIVTARRPPQR
jgi:hypothetical protein